MPQCSAQRNQRGKRKQELQRRRNPQGVAHVRAIVAERQRQQRADRREHRRLHKVIQDFVRHMDTADGPLRPDP